MVTTSLAIWLVVTTVCSTGGGLPREVKASAAKRALPRLLPLRVPAPQKILSILEVLAIPVVPEEVRDLPAVVMVALLLPTTEAEEAKWASLGPLERAPDCLQLTACLRKHSAYPRHSFFSKIISIYTWSPFYPGDAKALGLRPFPMLWGEKQTGDFARLVKPGYAEVALGFNECVTLVISNRV
jgi:hypothetical protein